MIGTLAISALVAVSQFQSAPDPTLQPSGRLGTLPNDIWRCGTPGDATGAAWDIDPERTFEIVNNSSYENGGAGGTYLLLGTSVTFTSGPMNGQRFERKSRNRIALLGEDGKPTGIACIAGYVPIAAVEEADCP